MERALDKLLTVVLILSAIAISGSVVYRSAISTPRRSGPTYVRDWQKQIANGYLLGGKPSAPVSVVVLSDLQCPACRGFHEVLRTVMPRLADTARFYYISHPLSYHKHAIPAALAAECAAKTGRLMPWLNAVFDNQDSLGSVSWGRLAGVAGISDTTLISSCSRAGISSPRIAAGLNFGKEFGLDGTPTVLIDGWIYGNLGAEELEKAIRLAASGAKPD